MNDYSGYKKCFIDVETTGLDPTNHNIFQISCIITDAHLNVLETCDWSFRPYSLEHVQDAALIKTGVSMQDLENRKVTSRQVYEQLIEMLQRHCDRFDKLDKMHFVAYNARFDCEFIRSFFEKHNDAYFGSWFWNPPVCVMQAAAWLTMRVRGALPNFKLETLCKCAELGWDESLAHDASYDNSQSVKLFKYLLKNISHL